MEGELPNIIGLTGFKGVGKTTVAKQLSVPRRSFADKVREVAQSSFGLTDEQMTDPALKEKPIEFWGMTPREILQEIGMMYRSRFGEGFWIRCLERRLWREAPETVVIDDCRFPNEAAWIQEHGIVVGLRRDGVTLDDDHESEVKMKYNWVEMTDTVVMNNGTPKETATTVQRIFEREVCSV